MNSDKYFWFSGGVQLYPVGDPDDAFFWKVNTKRQVEFYNTHPTHPEPTSVWASFPGTGANIQLGNVDSLPAYQSGPGGHDSSQHAIFCDLPGNCGSFTCEDWLGAEIGQLIFQLCPDNSGMLVIVDGVIDSAYDTSCEPFGFEAVPRCDLA